MNDLKKRITAVELEIENENNVLENKFEDYKRDMDHQPGLIFLGMVGGFALGLILSRQKISTLIKTAWNANKIFSFCNTIKSFLNR